MKCPEYSNPYRQKIDWCFQEIGESKNWEELLIEMEFIFQGDESVLEFDSGDVCTTQ